MNYINNSQAKEKHKKVLIWWTHKSLHTECENVILYLPKDSEHSILLTELLLQMMFCFTVKLIPKMIFPFGEV